MSVPKLPGLFSEERKVVRGIHEEIDIQFTEELPSPRAENKGVSVIEANESCSNCSNSAAVRVCACTSPPTLLCTGCLLNHESKTPLLSHTNLPIQALEACSRVQNFPNVLEMRRKGAVQAIENIKSENLPKIEEALKTVNQECEKIIEAVKRYQIALQKSLILMKSTLESEVIKATSEVGLHIYQAELQSAPELVWSIWNFSLTEPKPKFPYIKVVKHDTAQVIKAIESIFDISLDLPKGIKQRELFSPRGPSTVTPARKR